MVFLLLVLTSVFSWSSLTHSIRWNGGRGIDFSHLASRCTDISPIQHSSFLDRQQSLAETLHALNASAYIAEPGASAAYFANLSSSSWHLSERPLLLIVTPNVDEAGKLHARVSILTPSFEATRAKFLPIPSASNVTYPEWPEHENPYAAALAAVPQSNRGAIYVDAATRYFIVDGLQEAAPHATVQSAPVEIRRLRERKSQEELEILKCANEVSSRVSREKYTSADIGW